MTSITENPHTGGFILSLANGKRSLDEITVAAGQNLLAGAVVAETNEGSGQYVAYDNDSSDPGIALGVLLAAVDATNGAQPGVIVTRDAEVNVNELVFEDDQGTDDINAAIADLKSRGIIAR